MTIEELPAGECRAVLARSNVGRLACARDNQPYVVPIHYCLDGAYLYSFAVLGQKIAWMRENPKVCVQVDEITDSLHWTTVLVFGSYEELVHTPTYEDARQRAHALFEKRSEWWQPAATKIDPREQSAPVIYRIRIDRLSGRKAARHATGMQADETSSPASRPWWLSLIFNPIKGKGKSCEPSSG